MVVAHGVTNQGRVRKSNEDAFVVDEALGCYLVADGMGGHNAGDVASKIAVQTIRSFLIRSGDSNECTWPFGVLPEVSLNANRLVTAIKLANRRVFKTADRHDDYTGMGTTVVGALVQDNSLAYSSVGDSRLYSLVHGSLRQLTTDDSWGATLLAREPDVDEAALATHPMRDVLTNVLGATESTEVTVEERLLQGDETLLICSDGLYRALDGDTLQTLMSGADLRMATERLVDTALERDGSDNITAVLVRYTA